jgi:hypothetical protein
LALASVIFCVQETAFDGKNGVQGGRVFLARKTMLHARVT